MEAFVNGTGYSVDHVVNGYDWASIGAGTIVDVTLFPSLPSSTLEPDLTSH